MWHRLTWPSLLQVDPKIAVPDDVSMRGARGGGGGATDVKKTNKVFVGGVPHDMDEETISDYFKKFGEVGLGSVWSGLGVLGLVWSGLGVLGLVWSGLGVLGLI